MSSCGCQCTCPDDRSYSNQQSPNYASIMGSQLAKKPSIENGWTTDCYDDGEFELVE